MAQRRTTTQRGLGWKHRQQVASLFARHVDGSPCWWCAQPMWRKAERNFDQAMLEGDHSKARSQGGTRADRLLHSTCNRSRGAGDHDHQRPALTGKPMAKRTPADDRLGIRAMTWP